MGETFFEASERAMTGALFVNRSFGGCVESVLTVRTQRFFAVAFFAAVPFLRAGFAIPAVLARVAFFGVDLLAAVLCALLRFVAINAPESRLNAV